MLNHPIVPEWLLAWYAEHPESRVRLLNRPAYEAAVSKLVEEWRKRNGW